MAKMQVRRVGIFSYAKITAVTTAAFGLIFGIIYGLIVIIFGAAILAGGGSNTGAAGSRCCPASPAWIAIRSREVGESCTAT